MPKHYDLRVFNFKDLFIFDIPCGIIVMTTKLRSNNVVNSKILADITDIRLNHKSTPESS